MTRPPRIADPDAFWHVITRGNHEQRVYRDPYDRLDFLNRLSRVCARHGWECHAYCLMGTHYHLLVGFREPTLSRGMHQLNSGHAHMFNRRHELEGHVFERRFWAGDVRTDEGLLGAGRYIELNPVRAGLVWHPREWRWSSYRAHAGLTARPAFLTNLVCDVLSPRPDEGRRLWVEFVDAALGEATRAAAA